MSLTNEQLNQLLTNIQKIAKKDWHVIGLMQTSQYVDFKNEKTSKHRLVHFEWIPGGIKLKYDNGTNRDVMIEEEEQ